MLTVKKITTQEEFEKAVQIRKDVFVKEQNVPENEEYDEYEKSSTHFIAYLNGVPSGTCRWRETEKGIKLERFAVSKEARGQGVGEKLVEACLTDIQPVRNNRMLYLHAQEQAVPFYEKSGFETFGERFFECDIPHFKMKM